MNFAGNNWVDGDASPMVRVRGLRAPQAAPIHLCRHCGSTLTGAAAQASGFCCAGCGYVFRLVSEQGLGAYYRIRDATVAPVGEAVFQPRDFTWLEQLQREAEQPPGTPALLLEVQGISCAGCVWLIEKIFHQQAGALDIETDATLGRMRLRWTRGVFEASAFARRLQSFNYLVGPAGEEPAVPEARRLVRRVGLAAAFSMNVMLFTLPVYFGMEATFPYARLFGMLSMAFATLSVLTGGAYFIGRAGAALRAKTMHIDLPIAVGIVGAYLGSLYGWLADREAFVYFDFVSAFILLMLVGRWAQVATVERNRRRLLTPHRPDKVAVVTAEGAIAWRPQDALAAGESFEVGAGQIVPVESQLETAAATFGAAWITGESDPIECRTGTRVAAGSVNFSRGAVRLRAMQAWNDSLLAELLQPVKRDAYRHALLERIVRGYLVGILVVAAIAGAAWWFGSHDPVRVWSVVVAVLVVSCPCAVGLAFPLTDELATHALQRAGVFVRTSDLWPRVSRIRKIVFDKTGTLSLEIPRLRDEGALATLSPEALSALHTLVRDNAHPVSQSLNQYLLSSGLTFHSPVAGTVSESPGNGLTLLTTNERWTLGRPGWPNEERPDQTRTTHDADFALNGVVLARFNFADTVRPEAKEEIAQLREQGFQVCILSGDRQEKVEAMAGALGIPLMDARGRASPRDKAAWLKRFDRRDTLMLGDGANDSLAFDAAFVCGTPVIHRGVLEQKADFYYLGLGLSGLRSLFAVDAQRRRTQAWLLVFSITYNLLAIGLAVAGRMHPLLAAILMPISSLVSLGVVIAGMRRVLIDRRVGAET